jgi:predicted amidophosphoribosyltransferase
MKLESYPIAPDVMRGLRIDASVGRFSVNFLRCAVCDLLYESPSGGCHNPLCRSADRIFCWNHAILEKTDELDRAIKLFKYGANASFSIEFAIILLKGLEARKELFGYFDYIVASPVFVGSPPSPYWEPLGAIREAAYTRCNGRWPFETRHHPIIIKRCFTPRMAGNRWRQRREIAAALRYALHVPDPSFVTGRRILVFDDVFTSGHTLNEIARCLTKAGALAVCGISLTRQPFRGFTTREFSAGA